MTESALQLRRTLFNEEHDTYRDSLWRFLARDVVPHCLPEAGQTRIACAGHGRAVLPRRAGAGGKSTELQGRVTDRCVQLHGVHGDMREFPLRAPMPTHG